jgi:hypothetical protein
MRSCDTTCAAAFASHPDRLPASPTLRFAWSRCACLPLPASGIGPSPAVSRTPIARCRPIPTPSNVCACDWKTETDARSADRLPTHPAPIRTTLRNPCACSPLPPQYRSWSPVPDQTRDSALSHADQFLQIGRDEIPGTLDAPAVGQHQCEAAACLRLCLYRNLDQLRTALSFNSPPVIQSRDPDVVLGAILAPPHPAFGKTRDDVPHFLLASHSAIFGCIALAIKMGSSDAYKFETRSKLRAGPGMWSAAPCFRPAVA